MTGADPYLPGHGDARYHVEHYDLDLQYKVARNHLEGRGRAAADRASSRCPRSCSTCTASRSTSLRVDRRGRRPLDAPGLAAADPPAAPGRAGAELTVAVCTAAARARCPGPDGPTGWEELADGVIVAAQPHGAPTWFPCNDRLADKATYRITVRTDPGYRVVANGALTAAATGRPARRVGPRAARADVDVPRDPADRALRAGAPGRRRACRCALAAPPARMPAARARVRRPAADARRSSPACSGPTPSTVHRRRHRRPPRDPARVADPVDLRHQPPQPGLGGPAADRSRAGAPVVRQHRDRRLAARHLAARGLRLLRRVAVVGVDRAHDGAGGGRAAPRAAGPAAAGPRAHGPRRHDTPSTTGSTSAVRSPCTPCAAPWATTSSSRCCVPGSTSTASAWSPRPTSRSWCAPRRRRPRAAARPVAAGDVPAAAGQLARDGPLTWVDLRDADGPPPRPGHPTTQSVTSTRGPSTQRPRTRCATSRPRVARPPARPP